MIFSSPSQNMGPEGLEVMQFSKPRGCFKEGCLSTSGKNCDRIWIAMPAWIFYALSFFSHVRQAWNTKLFLFFFNLVVWSSKSWYMFASIANISLHLYEFICCYTTDRAFTRTINFGRHQIKVCENCYGLFFLIKEPFSWLKIDLQNA